ncbi:protein FAM83F [Sinocyclocheilus anshuiensis]|uniref:protein FAM83F n=1 Tax=Sinocyclocheilus anshuiensis TaxID=1608454 RepID=UPI0007BA13C4|nr:PREDICTED: protein FAM83F [Sinocyclocheilus anshuiensis]
MAESQLLCMEDGLMPLAVPESRPQFYYSEQHRAALELLITDGDGAFKSLLKDENSRDFLSAREIKAITGSFVKYKPEEDAGGASAGQDKRDDAESMRSTYWPQMSDTEVPPLDIGWPSSGLFKGVTRVSVYTHPPKENSPHIKEVARKLIQESCKVVAIVMDLLTDLQVLRDLFEASKRGVPVYIVLDEQGAPHFLDMCSRMQVGATELKNVRTRTVKGVGLNLSVGRIPGNVHSKYMLIDGDKVMFGTYSFSWSSSRMDRNMITVMSGQVVDFYDNDFRELYAISDKLDLFKEFHISKPQTGTLSRAAVPKRPAAATSRFQVNLGDATRADLKVPAHKYHNPKYLLALGQIPGPTEPLQDFFSKMEPADPEPEPENPTEELENITPVPSQPEKKESKKLKTLTFNTKRRKKGKKDQTSDAVIEENTANPSDDASKHTLTRDETQDSLKKKKRGLMSFFRRS